MEWKQERMRGRTDKGNITFLLLCFLFFYTGTLPLFSKTIYLAVINYLQIISTLNCFSKFLVADGSNVLDLNKVIWQRSISSHSCSPEMSFSGRERLRNEVDVPNT